MEEMGQKMASRAEATLVDPFLRIRPRILTVNQSQILVLFLVLLLVLVLALVLVPVRLASPVNMADEGILRPLRAEGIRRQGLQVCGLMQGILDFAER